MNTPTIADFQEVLSEHFEMPRETITEMSSFREDLGADSLDLVELSLFLEERYRVTLTEAEFALVVTVADAITLIKNRQSVAVAS